MSSMLRSIRLRSCWRSIAPDRGIAGLNFLAGFCYTQLTDVEQEINGLLRYDRQLKLPSGADRQVSRSVDIQYMDY